MRFLFKYVSRRLLLYRPAAVSKIFFSDYYYLAFPDDSFRRKALIYGVYAAELVQSILLAKKFYQEFAAGFGNLEAINDGSTLWFAVPILDSSGTYYPLFCIFRSFSHE